MQNQDILTISQESFNLSSDLVLFLDRELSLLWSNEAFSLFKQEHTIHTLHDFIDHDVLQKALDNHGDGIYNLTFGCNLLNFHAKFSQLHSSDIYVLVCNNTEHKQSIYNLTYIDPVTHVGNFTLSVKIINDFFEQTQHNPHLKMLMMGINFKNFERIDFVYGYDFGNTVLENFAQQLQRFKTNNQVFRTSGNQILLIHIFENDDLNIDEYTQQVVDVFDKPIKIDDHQNISISTSISALILPQDAQNKDEAMKNLFLTYEKSKTDYEKISTVFYQESFGKENQRKLSIEKKLEEEIILKHLELYYQPKVDVDNKKIYGFEALLRWKDPEFGSISPLDFIPIAEDSGKIVSIGLWVFEQVCSQINIWKTRGFYFKVSLNVSVRQLQDSNFIESFKKVLQETKVNTSLIELEITESILSESLEEITVLFKQIKELGLSISLDDFGTKYSSLSYLKNLPIDILKIDRSFIKDSCDSVKDAAIAKTIVTLAKELQLEVIAEGVETKDQVSLLEYMDCDYIQGFYYYKPMCVDDLDILLSQIHDASNIL